MSEHDRSCPDKVQLYNVASGPIRCKNIVRVDDKWRGASVAQQSSYHVHIRTHHKGLDTDRGCQTSDCTGDSHVYVIITVIMLTQRGDIALAITKCDMFDFLIDIVPREEILFKINRKQGANAGNPKVIFKYH